MTLYDNKTFKAAVSNGVSGRDGEGSCCGRRPTVVERMLQVTA